MSCLTDQFWQLTVSGLAIGSLYALIALGYTLVYGVLQLINFAHSEVFMFGAFGSYIVVHQIVGAGGKQNSFGVVAIIAIGLLSGALVSAGIAWLLERVAYRPLRHRGAPKLAFLISAIGASFFLVQLAGKLFNRFPGNAFQSYFQTDRRLFSIGTAVAGRRTENANGILPFAGVFLEEITTSQPFDWPCGEFYLSKLQTSRQAPIEFRIHGHVGIFVDGDVRLGNNLEVFLDPGASLDLVVAGTFSTSGRLFGAPTVPRHMRLWVGEAKVSLPDEIQFGAMVYAPSAAFTAGAGLVYSGSLFVSTVAINGDIGLTYDPGAADEGQLVCGVAPPPLIP